MIHQIQNFIKNNGFLTWYLNPRSKINRKTFMYITTVIFLVGGIFYYIDYKPVLDETTQILADLQTAKYSGNQISNEQFTAKILDLLNNSNSLLSSFVNILIFILIIPLIMMRLRDIGKQQAQIIKLILVIYAPVIIEIISYTGISITSFITIPAYTASFIIFSWIYIADSKKYIPPSQRNQLPPQEKQNG